MLIAGYASIPLVLLSVFAMMRTIGKPRPLMVTGLIAQILFSALFLLLYRFLLNLSEPTLLSWGLLGIGLFGGVFQGFTTKINITGDKITAKRSVIYLIIWGVSFSATQALAMLGQDTIAAYGLSSVYLATGIAIGMNATLLVRRLLTAPANVSPSILQGSICPKCAVSNSSTRKFCRNCGTALGSFTVPVGSSCPNCGQTATPTQKYCNHCGRTLQ
jgi:uncharacterized membrane protein YbaN (DUF454 family)/ribosomal protein L40E